jgi:hypothetical protein
LLLVRNEPLRFKSLALCSGFPLDRSARVPSLAASSCLVSLRSPTWPGANASWYTTHMRYFLFAFCLVPLAISSASGEPLDCEKLKRTNMPYQVTFTAPAQTVKTSDGVTRQWPGLTEVIQVYRDEDGFAVEYSWNPADRKNWSKILSRNGFDLEIGPKVPIATSYDPGPEENLYASKRDFNISYMHRFDNDPFEGSLQSTFKGTLSYRFTGSDYLVLGPCRFTILQYTQTIKPEGKKPTEHKFVYVPELRLRPFISTVPFPKEDENLLVEMKPTKIETDLQSFTKNPDFERR